MSSSKPKLVLSCLLMRVKEKDSMGGRSTQMRSWLGTLFCAWIIALYFGACHSCGLAIFSLILPDFLELECKCGAEGPSWFLCTVREGPRWPHSTPPQPLTNCDPAAPAAVSSALSSLMLASRSDTRSWALPTVEIGFSEFTVWLWSCGCWKWLMVRLWFFFK